MKPVTVLAFQFVQAIPEKPEAGMLYVSMDYATAVHKCCCGCGREVVTPLSPTDWKLTFDGVSVSLSPSIGNWSFPCQSHYWIARNEIRWADRWSPEKIQAGRTGDRRAKQAYYGKAPGRPRAQPGKVRPGLWSRIWKWVSGR
jgi:hypothetical protein